MPYAAGHQDRVRQQIVRSARRLFNRFGYDAVSIDRVMADAGLTRGAFYFYFRSKAELYRAAIAYVLLEHPLQTWADAADERPAAVRLVDAYLSQRHVDELEESCPLVTHSADAARGDPELASVFADVLRALIQAIGSGCDDAKDGDRVYSVAALCVGALSLARGVGDDELASRLLQAARTTAYDLAGWNQLQTASDPTRSSS